MNVGTLLLVLLVLVLLGGVSGIGGGPFYGHGVYVGGPIGLVIVVLLVLFLAGRL